MTELPRPPEREANQNLSFSCFKLLLFLTKLVLKTKKERPDNDPTTVYWQTPHLRQTLQRPPLQNRKGHISVRINCRSSPQLTGTYYETRDKIIIKIQTVGTPTKFSLRTADAFPVVPSLPPKNSVCKPERQNNFRDVKPF